MICFGDKQLSKIPTWIAFMVFGIWKEDMLDNCLARYGVRDESLVRIDMGKRGREEEYK